VLRGLSLGAPSSLPWQSHQIFQPVEKLGLTLYEKVLSGPSHGSAALAKALRGVRDRPEAGGEDFFNRLIRFRDYLAKEEGARKASPSGKRGLSRYAGD
jgi:hypothetical protein